MKAPVSTAIAIAFGLIVLLGYFIPLPLFNALRDILLECAIVLAGVAVFVGVANLFLVHGRKISRSQPGSGYSYVVIIAMLATIIVAALFGPTGYWSLWLFKNIQVPVETSLIGVLAIILVYAAARLLRRKLNLFSIIFFATALVVLLGSVPLLGIEIPGLHGEFGLRSLLIQLPAVAGARGILLGVALGALAAGIRVLMGVDRPYGG